MTYRLRVFLCVFFVLSVWVFPAHAQTEDLGLYNIKENLDAWNASDPQQLNTSSSSSTASEPSAGDGIFTDNGAMFSPFAKAGSKEGYLNDAAWNMRMAVYSVAALGMMGIAVLAFIGRFRWSWLFGWMFAVFLLGSVQALIDFLFE